jgi:hypothetical protein
VRYIGRSVRFGVLLVVTMCLTAVVPHAASASVCAPPKKAAKASLELLPGDLRCRHDLDTEGIRNVVNGLRGYVAGPWHVPLGLTVAEPGLRYQTRFYYWKAQSGGHCVALVEAKFSVGYDDMTVYISRDYPEGSCEYDVILAHEEEHVRLNREVLKAYERKFKQAIARVLAGKKTIFAHQKSAARAAYVKELERQLNPVVAEMAAARNRKNGAIDTQDSYRRLMAQCANWHGGDAAAPDQDGGPVQAAATPSADELAGQAAQTGAGEHVALAAPEEPADQAPAVDPDPTDYIGQGRQMSEANAKQLEAALASLPEHFPTRARLLGFYFHQGLATFGPAATIEARRRHILWLIENHPESPLAGLPEARIEPSGGDLADEEGYGQAKALWLEQAEKDTASPAARENAAAFLRRHDTAIAETLR